MSKVLLIILDGWGIGPDPKRSAIARAKTPVMDNALATFPNCTLLTHGNSVGLPEGQMGNSEVGHLTIGAGRVIWQDLEKINRSIASEQLEQNPLLDELVEYSRHNHHPIHLLGLVSDGGVHSHIDHLFALIDILHKKGAKPIYIHAFTDGRDTDPHSAVDYIQRLLNHIQPYSDVHLATIVGRYYAMDRDRRWQRTAVAYNALVHGKGSLAHDPIEAIQNSYEQGITDEFIKPIILTDAEGNPLPRIRPGDAAVFFNFRTDRLRQLLRSLTQEDFPQHQMSKLPLYTITMTEYDPHFKDVYPLFKREIVQQTLGEIIAQHNLKQLRIAETEKYPHVTYFFSGWREEPFENEKRILIPSPKVPTYDLQPEMSANEVTHRLIEEIEQSQPHFICLNYANPDMVGHTGVFKAVVKAVQAVDGALGLLIPLARLYGYSILITADHGNADYMINDDGSPNTAHTKNPVPCILIDPRYKRPRTDSGYLYDIAPTVLQLLQLPIPEIMTGKPLFIQ